MLKKKRSVTLLELVISMILLSMFILGIYSIDLFSRFHVSSADKQAKVENEISYAIEYMTSYVYQSIGDLNNPPIVRYPAVGAQTGFRVRVDLNDPQTPNDLSDDTWVAFYLSGNNLIVLRGAVSEVLTSRISGAFLTGVMPASPAGGFYVNITDQGIAVDIGLVARYSPTVAASLSNPQVSMKTRLVSPNSPAR